MQELAELPRPEVQAELVLRLLVVREVLVPHRRAVDGDGLLGHAEQVERVDLLGPVDAVHLVPLLVLALLVQRQQLVAAVVVLPGEARRSLRLDVPRRHLDGDGVQLVGAHACSSSRDVTMWAMSWATCSGRPPGRSEVAEREPGDGVGDEQHARLLQSRPVGPQVLGDVVARRALQRLAAGGQEGQQTTDVVGEHGLEQRVAGGLLEGPDRRRRRWPRQVSPRGRRSPRQRPPSTAPPRAARAPRRGRPWLRTRSRGSAALTPAARATSAIRTRSQSPARAASYAASSSASRVVTTVTVLTQIPVVSRHRSGLRQAPARAPRSSASSSEVPAGIVRWATGPDGATDSAPRQELSWPGPVPGSSGGWPSL